MANIGYPVLCQVFDRSPVNDSTEPYITVVLSVSKQLAPALMFHCENKKGHSGVFIECSRWMNKLHWAYSLPFQHLLVQHYPVNKTCSESSYIMYSDKLPRWKYHAGIWIDWQCHWVIHVHVVQPVIVGLGDKNFVFLQTGNYKCYINLLRLVYYISCCS